MINALFAWNIVIKHVRTLLQHFSQKPQGYHFSSRVSFFQQRNVYLVGFHFSSGTKILKFISSNHFFSTSKTPKMKKSPISRTNIFHFETIALYQNVSYKMVGKMRFELTVSTSRTQRFTKLSYFPKRGIFIYIIF